MPPSFQTDGDSVAACAVVSRRLDVRMDWQPVSHHYLPVLEILR
ncbi:MAG: hypothetical protein AB7F43_13095 [Bacteriovoracia bacterium]